MLPFIVWRPEDKPKGGAKKRTRKTIGKRVEKFLETGVGRPNTAPGSAWQS